MAATSAAKNRAIRQDALREQLSKQKHVEHVVEISNKLADLEGKDDAKNKDMDALQIQRLRAAADIKNKIIDKYLPNLKSTELTGEGGGDIGIDAIWRIEVVKDA